MATNTTKVHRDFVNDPKIKEKDVIKVPGIGKVIAGRLKNDGRIATAGQLYDIYQQRTKDGFKKIIRAHGGNSEHQEDAYRGMKEWEWQRKKENEKLDSCEELFKKLSI